MVTFLKLQLSAFVATMCDWLITFLFTSFWGLGYLFSGISGTISGGAVNFMINRNMVFLAQKITAIKQAKKYVLIWLGYLGLSALGLYLLTDLFHLNYMVSKISVSVFLGISYNYFFQKKYVFKVDEKQAPDL
jgi:putative flippase GtrA